MYGQYFAQLLGFQKNLIIFGIRKQECMAIVRRCLHDNKFNCFDKSPAFDEQTDRQTDTHSVYRACIASRGKSYYLVVFPDVTVLL